MKRHGRREMIGEGRLWEVQGSKRREKIGEEETRRDDAGGRGGRPGTLPLPWVRGSCDGGDVGGETPGVG